MATLDVASFRSIPLVRGRVRGRARARARARGRGRVRVRVRARARAGVRVRVRGRVGRGSSRRSARGRRGAPAAWSARTPRPHLQTTSPIVKDRARR